MKVLKIFTLLAILCLSFFGNFGVEVLAQDVNAVKLNNNAPATPNEENKALKEFTENFNGYFIR